MRDSTKDQRQDVSLMKVKINDSKTLEINGIKAEWERLAYKTPDIVKASSCHLSFLKQISKKRTIQHCVLSHL